METSSILSRKNALASGSKRYFTGLVCKRGHFSERLVVDCSCMECNKLKNANRLKENRKDINATKKARRLLNIQKFREVDRAYKFSKREEINKKQRKDYADDPEKHREYQRRYYSGNLKKKRAYARVVQSARYRKDSAPFKAAAKTSRAKRKMAIPSWFGEFDAFVWDEASALSGLRKAATGIDWHADHMLPIKAKQFSGFHVWNNCQVIPAVLNQSKNNRAVYTNPGEWIGVL